MLSPTCPSDPHLPKISAYFRLSSFRQSQTSIISDRQKKPPANEDEIEEEEVEEEEVHVGKVKLACLSQRGILVHYWAFR